MPLHCLEITHSHTLVVSKTPFQNPTAYFGGKSLQNTPSCWRDGVSSSNPLKIHSLIDYKSVVTGVLLDQLQPLNREASQTLIVFFFLLLDPIA